MYVATFNDEYMILTFHKISLSVKCSYHWLMVKCFAITVKSIPIHDMSH